MRAEELRPADDDRPAVHLGPHAQPGHGAEARHGGTAVARQGVTVALVLAAVAPHPPTVGARAERRAPLSRVARARVRTRAGAPPPGRPVQRDDVAHRGSSLGQRPRLVEGDDAQARRLLEVRAALDEDAVPRRVAEGREDAHRRRDHERARARDDEQGEAAVDPRVPGGAEGQRRHEDDRRGQGDRRPACTSPRSGRRSPAPARAWPAPPRRGGRSWRWCCRRRSPWCARAASRPRGWSRRRRGRPGPFVTGSGSPVIAASFAAATPSSDDAVDGERARPGARRRSRRRRSRRPARASSTPSRTHGRDRRRELHEPRDRPSRAVERRRLEHGAEAEEKGDEARLGPLADRHRADHGEAHEDVHVDLAGAQREEGGAGDEAAAEDGGGGEEEGRRRGRRARSAAKPATTKDARDEDEAGAPVGQPEAARRRRRTGVGRRTSHLRRPPRAAPAASPPVAGCAARRCRTPGAAPSGTRRRGRCASGR